MALVSEIRIIAGLLCLLAATACGPSSREFATLSGYDEQGLRTGSVLPPPGTFTPY